MELDKMLVCAGLVVVVLLIGLGALASAHNAECRLAAMQAHYSSAEIAQICR